MQNATNTVKVTNMRSTRSGSPVANQFVIETPEGEFFQSYKSVIVRRDNDGNITLDEKFWDYSPTTSRYRKEFLAGESTKETQLKIDSGEYDIDEDEAKWMIDEVFYQEITHCGDYKVKLVKS